MSSWIERSDSSPFPEHTHQFPHSPSVPADERREKTILMTLGPCMFTAEDGLLKISCLCKEGSSTSTLVTAEGVMNTLCSKCKHPLAQHADYVSSRSTAPPGDELSNSTTRKRPNPHSEALTPAAHPDLCPRLRTVQTLAQLLNDNGVVHVRGTPGSGKTTLAGLLHNYLIETRKVILIDLWNGKTSATEFLVQKCHDFGYREVQVANFYCCDIVFIIDEAQQSYVDSNLWYTVIKSRIGVSTGPQLCLFSSYGSPTCGAPDYPAATVPPILNFSQRVSLTVSQNQGSPDICLFYDFLEFQDAICRFCSNPTTEFTVEPDVQGYLFRLTNGHPSMVRSLMEYIRTFHRVHLERSGVSKITMTQVQDLLDDDDAMFRFLEHNFAGRSLASRTTQGGFLDPDVIRVLLSILRDGSGVCDRNDRGVEECFRRGWVHTEQDKENKLICVLPSALHARFVEFYYGQMGRIPFPYSKYPNVQDLCMRIIRRFSGARLRDSRDSQRFGPSGKLQPPETVFQDEFYRCYWHEVGSGIGISSDWAGTTSEGRVDFQILDPGWGVELLRDGDDDRIKEHCNRFSRDGIYYRWIRRGLLKDWMILDCRHSYPRTKYPGEGRLWRIVFDSDYTSIRILDCENNEIVPEFCLANP